MTPTPLVDATPGLVDQPNALPTRKVTGGIAGGAIACILVWAANRYLHADVPPEVAGALATIIGGGVAYIVRDRATAATVTMLAAPPAPPLVTVAVEAPGSPQDAQKAEEATQGLEKLSTAPAAFQAAWRPSKDGWS